MQSHLESKISMLLAGSVDQVGFTNLSSPISISTYKDWLDKGHHGNMAFLKEHLPKKISPTEIHPQLKSAIVVGKDYFPHPKPMDLGFKSELNKQGLKIGSYALGQDYHYWLKDILDSVMEKLRVDFPDEVFISYTDSGPVLERDLAYRAGLGWVGKNTCLIHAKKGSLFFIGEILTSINLNPDKENIPDRCGTCTRCIDACPTGALTERSLDARKCISYLTIEHKPKVDPLLAKDFSGWFYGCDICQAVCPWNEKVFGKESFLDVNGSANSSQEMAVDERKLLVSDLKALCESSNKALARRFRGSPMTRANGNMHKRNALIVAVNYQLRELEPAVRQLLETSESEMLLETAEWFLEQDFLRDF